MKHSILIVDDDPRLTELVSRYFTEQGFIVHSVANGREMDSAITEKKPDCIILDLMLPGEDGLAIVRRLRSGENRLPIIMLTARGDDNDRVLGLDNGADDYLPKPFNPRELLARVNALIRRNLSSANSSKDGNIQFGEFSLNLDRRMLFRNNSPIELTNGEYTLLYALASHPNRPMAREQLMSLSSSEKSEAYDRSIDVRISRLRRLIEISPGKPQHIQTVWGYGYVFVP
ncbi:MAG TPA: response regulator [Burkholderiales bacterium]|nr:response regulator [Burkholderiales bacterium]